jgi:uncharacterized protein
VATERPLPAPADGTDGGGDGGGDGRLVTLSVADPHDPAVRVVIRGPLTALDEAAASVQRAALATKYLGRARPEGSAPLAVLVIAPVTAEDAPTGLVAGVPPDAPDPDANTAVVVDMLDALARGDRARARAAFAVDATWQCPPSMPWPPFYEGRDAIFDEYFAVDVDLFETGVSEYDLEVLNAVAERDQVSIEMRHRGVGLGGQPYETDHSLVYVVRDGLIVAVREYIDTLYLTRALLG